MKLKRIKQLYKTFGPRIAFFSACETRFRWMAPWKHRYILQHLREQYGGFIARHQQKEGARSEPPAPAGPAAIWTVWWQGEDRLPEVVKLCHASVRQHRGAHPFIILTQDNYQEYVDLPGYIMDKVRSGAIDLIKLANIIRFALLSRRGGLWLDSTVFVTGGIPEDIFSAEYYTVKRRRTPGNHHVAQDRWTSFIQAGKRGNALCDFMLDFYMEYYREDQVLIDYFIIDYMIYLAYENLPRCRELLDAVPLCDDDLYRLERLMNSRWDPAVFASIEAATHFSKLSWRKGGRKERFGRETIYGHLLAEAEAAGWQ